MLIFSFENKFITEAFLTNYIKTVLPGIIVKQLSTLKNKEFFEDRLTEHFEKNITFLELIKAFRDNIQVKRKQDTLIAELDENKKLKGISIAKIVRFVDYGNLSTKGSNIFNTAIDYSKKNIQKYNPFLIW